MAVLTLFWLATGPALMAQDKATTAKAQHSLNAFFATYRSADDTYTGPTRMQKMTVDAAKRNIDIIMDGHFAQQQFTKKSVRKLYDKVSKVLPKPYNKYDIGIYANGMRIETLVAGSDAYQTTLSKGWGDIDYDDEPWVSNQSRPVQSTHGLYDRHITLWASHGRYYDQEKGRWKWQRPNLFCTTEDLFTQTIVVPYLIPMLENAGANVFTPRERDWQTAEVIVDNDGSSNASRYLEGNGKREWVAAPGKGFAWHAGTYQDGENPFEKGSARMTMTVKKEKQVSAVTYQPNLPQDGRYAVYVSYPSLEGSVPDAEYLVYHKGQVTVFHVNQRMGGGTWVYLGTFDFDKGCSNRNRVVMTNLSKKKGLCATDAVRFGGGMGNIERGGTTSGLPRCLEGARYYAQWAGAPYKVYSSKAGSDDYKDDINVRSLMSNWLAGGSVYEPLKSGLGVPVELSLAVHSDAGYAPDGKSLVGSLAICTTDFNDGRLNAGVSRQMSKDFASALLTGLMRDLPAKYGTWAKRYLWDRNYSETRLPEVPSAILETMSHQNFPDMVLGQDPEFKFTLARSIYKTILRFINGQHGKACVVEPLAPVNFSIDLRKGKALLRWASQPDNLEPTAQPTSYNVYMAVGDNGFDNGTNTRQTTYEAELTPGQTYHFKVTAVNRGGESFPTGVLSVCYRPEATKTILIVDGFQRLSAPAIINNADQQGFDMDADPGVSHGLYAGWSGKQLVFNRQRMGDESENGLGYCGNEMAGKFIMGNSFDYVRCHADAISGSGKYNIVSCSRGALESGTVSLNNYQACDLILGLQKYTPSTSHYYKTFTPTLQRQISFYLQGGGKLLVSGAYVGSDMTTESDQTWLRQNLHCVSGGVCKTDTVSSVNGLGLNFDFYRMLNDKHYAVTHADILMPQGSAFTAMQYGSTSSAAVAYKATDATFVMGFPFEAITDKSIRQQTMNGILNFLFQ